MCVVWWWCVRAIWCAVWCVCCLCVTRLGTRKTPVCRFKTPPCVPAKRAHVFNMRAFCQYTRRRFEPTHGEVLNLHTGRREGWRGGWWWWGGGEGVSLFSLFSLSLFPSLFLSSVVLFLLLSFSSLFPLLSSLSLLSQQQWQ